MIHSLRLRGAALLWCLLATTIPFPAPAGEAEQAQPYEKISYPDFKNGRLSTLLEADQATAYDLAAGAPRIHLENVVITMYDHSEESLALPDDRPLPVRMIITSDRGYLSRRPSGPNTQPEEIATLEGNVLVRRYRVDAAAPEAPPREVETEIRCQHAQWNRTFHKLHSEGDVEFRQEDSRLYGTGFLYLPDDEVMETEGDKAAIKDWGGIAFIEENARMEIGRDDDPAGHTVITCKETASYKLTEREIQFERDVRVERPGLVIESDILKVFLRRVEDMPEDAGGQVLPGQVRNIIATIGKRPGSVVIKSPREDRGAAAGAGEDGEAYQFLAKGSRADFDYDANRITLIDTRETSLPSVEFGEYRNRIRDDNLIFTFVETEQPASEPATSLRPAASREKPGHTLDTLTAYGGHGEVVLRNRPEGGEGRTEETLVSYAGELVYDRTEGRIRFRDRVDLKRQDLAIKAEVLDIRLTSDGGSPEPDQISRIIAETDVTIETGSHRSAAHRAEYDFYSAGGEEKRDVDTLRLFGPPQRTPPHPWIRNQRGDQITAPEIHMQRLKTVTQKDRHLLVAGGGTSECVFYTEADDSGDVPKVITIRCDRGVEFNEVEERAHFEGGVMVTSDSPDDNYVLTSDRLIINFKEIPDPKDPADTLAAVRRITADGNASLVQDVRAFDGDKIIRDFPTLKEKEGEIYLQSAPPRDGAPGRPARYLERQAGADGARFEAVLIKSNADGSLIEANGPGTLSVPDDLPGMRSEIVYELYAAYESFAASKTSRANFRKGVVLRQPSSNLIINSEELIATFMRDDEPEAASGDEMNIQRIGRLRRAEFRNGVKVDTVTDQGSRLTAVGERGSVDLETTGNITKISTERRPDSRERARIQDDRGMVLLSPAIEMRDRQGYIRADGPGELHLPGNAAGESLAKVPSVVTYGDRGSMIYNELALNIKISDRVRIIQPGTGNNWRQPSLDGNCDHLEITLFEPPEAGMSGETALSKVMKMDAQGGVVVRVYADAPPDNPNIDWLSRPGTTIFTRGDRGEFFVPENRIEISAVPGRQPQLLLNVVDPPRAPHRQRMKADRFILDTGSMPRRWSFHGQQESSTIREGEPFDFLN